MRGPNCARTAVASSKLRRKSPVAASVVEVPPWYERYIDSTFRRPVYRRATRTAASFASAPPDGKRKPLRSAGITSESSAASRARGSVAARPPYTKGSALSCRATASCTAGGGEWPRLTQIACDVQSMYSLPAASYR